MSTRLSRSRTVPLYDFEAQYAPLRDELLAAVTRVFDSQTFILGPEVSALEREVAAYSMAGFAVGCASGSDALVLALMAADVRAGDHVITTPFTFFATAGAISRLGARPLFVDVDEASFTLSPDGVHSALAKNDRVKAIVPVHLYGGCADMQPILEMAHDYGCEVIEDAAQAIGAECNGRRVGGLGSAGCFSFYPTKNLGAAGEGGVVTTNDPDKAERIAALRVHGSRRRYYHDEVGFNSRLDAIQAAVLRVKLRYLDRWTAARQQNAALYSNALGRLKMPVRIPRPAPWQTRHIWNQYVIRAERRDELQAWLGDHGVATDVYYPLALHQQACFSDLEYGPGDFPVAERLCREVLALPIADVQPDDVAYVCATIGEFYGRI